MTERAAEVEVPLVEGSATDADCLRALRKANLVGVNGDLGEPVGSEPFANAVTRPGRYGLALDRPPTGRKGP